jgi:hypothetical protein
VGRANQPFPYNYRVPVFEGASALYEALSGINPMDLGDLFTDVEGNNTQLPVSISLSQNYPNPFNPTTTIQFSLPHSTFVSLKVFNTLGQEVSNLVGEEKAVGNYKVEWNADGVASGVYLYRLISESLWRQRKCYSCASRFHLKSKKSPSLTIETTHSPLLTEWAVCLNIAPESCIIIL